MKAFQGEVEGSVSGKMDAKALQEDLQSPGFTPSLTKPKLEKESGRRRPAHKMKQRNDPG